jgi:hypothetical protein
LLLWLKERENRDASESIFAASISYLIAETVTWSSAVGKSKLMRTAALGAYSSLLVFIFMVVLEVELAV